MTLYLGKPLTVKALCQLHAIAKKNKIYLKSPTDNAFVLYNRLLVQIGKQFSDRSL